MSPRDPLVSLLTSNIGVTSARHHAWTFMWDSGNGSLSFACTLSVFPVPLSSVVPIPLLWNVLEARFWMPHELLLLGRLFWLRLLSWCPLSSLLPSHVAGIFPLTGLIRPTISSEFWKSVSSASSTPLIFFPHLGPGSTLCCLCCRFLSHYLMHSFFPVLCVPSPLHLAHTKAEAAFLPGSPELPACSLF